MKMHRIYRTVHMLASQAKPRKMDVVGYEQMSRFSGCVPKRVDVRKLLGAQKRRADVS